MIQPQHIKVERKDIAENVIVSGDQDRVSKMSVLLENAKLVNTNRFLIYTGEYKGKRVTIASHGMGMPSIAIAAEELYALGAKKIVRVGSTGALLKGLTYRDVIVAGSADAAEGGIISEYFEKHSTRSVPSRKLTADIEKNLSDKKIKFISGPIFSTEAFFGDRYSAVDKARDGFVSVEMESYILFALAELRGFEAATVLVVSDNILNNMPILKNEDIMNTFLKISESVMDAF